MSLFQLVIIALVQGLTEFLPISSSGHLLLVPALTHWPDQGIAIDVACHLGTLVAVLLYFYRDVWMMAHDVLRYPASRKATPGVKLFAFLIIGTIPAVALGWYIHHLNPDGIRDLKVVAWTMGIFAILLWIADSIGMKIKKTEHMNLAEAVLIGIGQAVALIPGVSRSGMTLTVARFLGYERVEAARFSMLLGIPAILGAGALAVWEWMHTPGGATLHEMLTAFALSALFGLMAIAFLMQWLKKMDMKVFVFYRLALAALLLAWLYYGFNPLHLNGVG